MASPDVVGGTFLTSPLFVEVILPFVLVFTVIFAILQKTKVLGEGKRQIDSIVALVVALIVVSFRFATGVIVSLVPFLAVAVVIILVFMILYGMVFKSGEFQMPKGLTITFGILSGIAVIIAVLVTTGAWGYLLSSLPYAGDSSFLWTNVLFVAVIIGAIVAVVGVGKRKINS